MAKRKTAKRVTLIAVNASIEGDVRFSGELYVNGSVAGDIVAEEGTEATLVVSDEGSVTGEIHVTDAVICGAVEGDVRASGRVELGKNARLRGDLYYKLVEVHNGAVIDGRMVPREVADSSADPAAALARRPESSGGFADVT